MAVFLDFLSANEYTLMKNQSKRGRKRTRWFQLKFRICGRDDWLQLQVPDVARLAGVSEKTVYHWIAGSKTPSPQVMALLEIVAGGVMPWAGWQDWRFCPVTGRLIAPNRISFTPAELEWPAFQKEQIRALEKDKAELAATVATLQAQIAELTADRVTPFPRQNRRG